MTKLEAVRAGVGVLGGDINAFLGACRVAAKKAPENIRGQAAKAITYFRAKAKNWFARYMAGPDFREPLRDLSQSDSARYVYKSLKGHITLLLIFSAAINILYLAPSLFMMQVYDRVLPTSGLLTLVFLALVLLFAFVIMAVLDAQRSKILTRASMRVERLFGEPLLRMSLSGDKKREGNGIRDLDSVRGGLTSPAIVGFLDLPFMPIYIIACFMLHPILGALAIGGAAIILGVALANERASRKSLAEVSQTSVNFYASHDAYMRANSTIRALGAEEALLRRRLQARHSLLRAQSDAAFANAAYASAAKTVRLILQSASLALGCYLAIEKQISPGAIIAVSILTARAYAPVEQIVGGWRQIGQALTAFKSLTEQMDQEEAAPERTPLPAPAGGLRLIDMSALGPDGRTPVLKNITFDAAPGEIVGILGPSGAGKSTLARILANAEKPSHGEVRIDGARYRDWDGASLAAFIGYLPQGLDLLDGTIAENISSFAVSDSSEGLGKDVVAAALLAGAHELILSLPKAYETRLGLGGAGLSPGQAQRVALARAVFGSPKVVVMDEPNAHLDGDGDLALAQTMKKLRDRGAMVFVVAHRVNTVAFCDKLLVLREGRIWEFGPREEVLAKMASHAKQKPTLVASK